MQAATRHKPTPRLLAVAAGLLYACVAAIGARADDTEIFFNQNIGNVAANVLFILDTSGSMNDTVSSQLAYDPSKTYSGNKCSAAFSSNNLYFSNRGNPACGSTNFIAKTQNKCATMMAAINATGYATDAFVQWGSATSNRTRTNNGVTTTTATQTYKWQNTVSAANTSGFVECKLDAGRDGDGVDNTKLFATTDAYTVTTTTVTPPGTVTATTPATGGQLTGLWDAAKNYFQAGTGTVYTFYSANYLNWLYDSSQSLSTSKMAAMETAASSLISGLSGVNVGLARYNYGGSGGMILAPVADLTVGSNRQDRVNLVKSWAPAGITPLSETYYEAYLYFSGGAVNYGLNSTSTTCTLWSSPSNQCQTATSFAAPSVAATRTGGVITSKTYDSPADYSCRKNFIVYLTDGLPNENSGADKAIQALPNFAQLGGSCDANVFSGANGGKCLGALAQYMYNADLRADVAKVQNVTSYFIGFGADFLSGGAPTAAFQYLQSAATRGGGKAFTADSLAGLTETFNQILAEVIKVNTTFTAPAVAVNAFNRTQTLNDLYVSVFSPRLEYHWPGNVKKYKLVNGQVVDSQGTPAVNASNGFFLDGTQSFWSAVPDGGEVRLGGAASNLPDFSKRIVYTTNASGTGTYPALIPLRDASLTATDFNLGANDPAQVDLVNWSYGQDVQDAIGPNSLPPGVAGTTDTRHEMGDPIHTQPVVVIYGKKGDGTDDTVIYAPSNDGYLHAIDGSMSKTGADTTGSGVELWSFIPNEMLKHLKDIYTDDPVTAKHYGIDGPVTVLRYDVNADGTISGNDRVILYFGTGRNADTAAYYALDVTNKSNPTLLWKIDASTLTGLGQAWSQPTITRVNIQGASQNSQHLALVIGGGYDAAEDNYVYNKNDGVGNDIYIVDALKGTLLWRAGLDGSANLSLKNMDHAIPAQVSALDLDGDGYADRLYAGDMAAQLFRIDLFNGQGASGFATGGVIASLGTHDDLLVHPVADQRRFYSTPDVSAEQKQGTTSFVNIAIGSGYRGHPLSVDTADPNNPLAVSTGAHDRFYSIRDYDGFVNQNQKYFDNYNVIRDSANLQALQAGPRLVNITKIASPVLPDGSAGWQLDMNTHPGWIAGEKVLAPSRTFNGSIIFTSYSPNTTPATDPCSGVGAGTNRVYVVDVFSGAGVIDRNKDGTITTDERSQDLRQGGIAPEAAFLFPAPTTTPPANCTGPACTPCVGAQCANTVTCLSGVEVLNVCSNLNRVRKTYWREGEAN
jgi:type IV pilus assembly protein PilY1